jgi:hypothetical protein
VVRSRSHGCRGEAIGITVCEYESIASDIHHVRRMRRIFSPVTCLAIPYPVYCLLFEKNMLLEMKCMFLFLSSTSSETFLNSKNNSARYHQCP